MAPSEDEPGVWMIRGVDKRLMTQAKVQAAIEQKTLRQFVIDAVTDYLQRRAKLTRALLERDPHWGDFLTKPKKKS
jgi:hypothetical protein